MDAAQEHSQSVRGLIPVWVAKPLLALTGLFMVAFVAIHMLGNLKILIDPDSMDAYAAWLRELLVPLMPYEGALWIFRILLLLAIFTHILCALALKASALRTRTPGAGGIHARRIFASAMLPTGILLAILIVLHILDLTLGVVVASAAFRPPDPAFHAAANVLASLSRPLAGAGYALFLIALGLHLFHGIGLAVKDLGMTGRRGLRIAEIIGAGIAVAIILGDGAVLCYSLMKGLAP